MCKAMLPLGRGVRLGANMSPSKNEKLVCVRGDDPCAFGRVGLCPHHTAA